MTKVSQKINILTQTDKGSLVISYSDKDGIIKLITYWPKTGKSSATERDAINVLDEVKEYLMTHDFVDN